MEIVICVVCSVAASVITTKILATHYFKIVDGYVDDVCSKTKEFVEQTSAQREELQKHIEEYTYSVEELKKIVNSLKN